MAGDRKCLTTLAWRWPETENASRLWPGGGRRQKMPHDSGLAVAGDRKCLTTLAWRWPETDNASRLWPGDGRRQTMPHDSGLAMAGDRKCLTTLPRNTLAAVAESISCTAEHVCVNGCSFLLVVVCLFVCLCFLFVCLFVVVCVFCSFVCLLLLLSVVVVVVVVHVCVLLLLLLLLLLLVEGRQSRVGGGGSLFLSSFPWVRGSVLGHVTSVTTKQDTAETVQ